MPPQANRPLFFGFPLDPLSKHEILDAIHMAMRERRPLYQVTLNTATLVTALQEKGFAQYIDNADLITADGMGIVWGGRSLGIQIPERAPGIDIMYDTLTLCEEKGYKPYFLGAREDVLKAALQEASRLWPRLKVAGSRHGYFSQEEEQAVADDIRQSNPDCLFVGISSPLKERFCHRWRAYLTVPYIVGVGGSFDILAGKTKRAPGLMQKTGTEWVFRIYQEPRRMLWRYCSTNLVFVLRMLHALVSGHGSSEGRRKLMQLTKAKKDQS